MWSFGRLLLHKSELIFFGGGRLAGDTDIYLTKPNWGLSSVYWWVLCQARESTRVLREAITSPTSVCTVTPYILAYEYLVLSIFVYLIFRTERGNDIADKQPGLSRRRRCSHPELKHVKTQTKPNTLNISIKMPAAEAAGDAARTQN